jgi:glutaredoxin 3
MAKIVIYTKENCAYCRMAKEFFNTRGLSFEEIRVDDDPDKLNEMIKLTQRRTLPQIFINDKAIGGYDDLAELAKSGKISDFGI